MDDRQLMDLQCSGTDDSAVITCYGPLVSENCERLRRAIDVALARGVQRLRLDLAGVSAMDDSGSDCLERTMRRCESSGVGFTVEPRPTAGFDLNGRTAPILGERRAGP